MDKHEQAVQRGEEAARLKASPVFEQAFADTRAAIMETWAQLDPGEKERAAELLLMVKCVDRVRRCIDAHIDTGKIAHKELEARKKRIFTFGRAA